MSEKPITICMSELKHKREKKKKSKESRIICIFCVGDDLDDKDADDKVGSCVSSYHDANEAK